MKEMPSITSGVLCWPKRLLSADDLRRHLTSQRELLLLPRTVITPLAADELKAKGIQVTWQTSKAKETPTKQGAWCYAQEKPDAAIVAAMQALDRDGITLTKLDGTEARAIAETIIAAHVGGIVFCGDPATVCCIANKIAGVRAAAILSAVQIAGIISSRTKPWKPLSSAAR